MRKENFENSEETYSIIKDFLFIGSFLPKTIKKKVFPFVESIISRIFFLVSYRRLSVYVLIGNEKNSGNKLSILFMGKEIPLFYLSKTLFNDKVEKKKIDEISIWHVNKFLKSYKNNVDMVIINTDRFYSSIIRKFCSVIIPEWISFLLDTSRPLQEIEKSFSRGARNDVKRIKKIGYCYEISDDPDMLLFFYNRMFLPYIKMKYGSEIPSSYYEYIKTLLQRDSVLLVKDDDKFVCGGLIEKHGKKAQLPSMGILDGNLEYLEKSASAALFYFHIIAAKENGINLLNYGDAHPFLNDGGFQFKRKWGMYVTVSNFQFGVFGFRFNNLNNSVLSFLTNNPFIFLDKDNLNCYIFKDEKMVSSNDIYHLFKSYYTKGVSKFIVVSFKGFSDDVKDFCPDGFKNDILHSKFIDRETDMFILSKK